MAADACQVCSRVLEDSDDESNTFSNCNGGEERVKTGITAGRKKKTKTLNHLWSYIYHQNVRESLQPPSANERTGGALPKLSFTLSMGGQTNNTSKSSSSSPLVIICERCCESFERLDQLHWDLEAIKNSIECQLVSINSNIRGGYNSIKSLWSDSANMDVSSWACSVVGKENILQTLRFLGQLCESTSLSFPVAMDKERAKSDKLLSDSATPLPVPAEKSSLKLLDYRIYPGKLSRSPSPPITELKLYKNLFSNKNQVPETGSDKPEDYDVSDTKMESPPPPPPQTTSEYHESAKQNGAVKILDCLQKSETNTEAVNDASTSSSVNIQEIENEGENSVEELGENDDLSSGEIGSAEDMSLMTNADEGSDNVEDVKNSAKIRIKYSRDFLLRIGNQSGGIKEFKPLEHGFPDLVIGSNPILKKPKGRLMGKVSPGVRDFINPFGVVPISRNKSSYLNMQPSIHLVDGIVRIGNLGMAMSQNPPTTTEQAPAPPTVSCLKESSEEDVIMDSNKASTMKSMPANSNTATEQVEFLTIGTPLIFKETTHILKMLTEENLEQSVTKFVELLTNEKDNGQILSIAKLVFEAAINEPISTKTTLYARMIEAIHNTANQTSIKFKKQIPHLCQLEFHKKCLNENDMRRSLGNLRFMGELYKLDMIQLKIMMQNINLLLQNPKEESIERLCILLTLFGPKLGQQLNSSEDGTGEALKFISDPNWMDKIFTQLRGLAEERTFLRIRPKILKVVVDLWENDWKISRGDTPTCPMPKQDHLTSVHKKVNDPCSAPQVPQQPTQTPPNLIQNTDPEDVVIHSIVRKAVAILNKITAENFEQSAMKFMELPLEDKDERISNVVSVLFERAINETSPINVANYSKLLQTICKTSLETSKKFRKQILDQCQREFLKSSANEKDIKEVERKLTGTTDVNCREQLNQHLQKMKSDSRKKSVGNIRFIGELYKLQMLTPKVMVECVHLLLYAPDEEKLECLCVLLTVIGQKLDLQLKSLEEAATSGDKPKFIPEPNWMTKIFAQLKELSKDEKFSFKARCKILNVLELRNRKWNSSNTVLKVTNEEVMGASSIGDAGRKLTGSQRIPDTTDKNTSEPPVSSSSSFTNGSVGWDKGSDTSTSNLSLSKLSKTKKQKKRKNEDIEHTNPMIEVQSRIQLLMQLRQKTETPPPPLPQPLAKPQPFQMHQLFSDLSQYLKNNQALKGTNQSCTLLLQAIQDYLDFYLGPPPPGVLFKDAFSADLRRNLSKFRNIYPFSTGMNAAVNAIVLELGRDDYNKQPKKKIKVLIDQYLEKNIRNAVKAIVEHGKEQICNGDVIMVHSITDAVINLLEKAVEDGKTFELRVVQPITKDHLLTTLSEILEEPIRKKAIIFSSIGFKTSVAGMRNCTKLIIGGHGLFTASGDMLAQYGSNHLAMLATRFNKPTIFLCESYKMCDRLPADLTSPDDQCQTKSSVKPLKINYDVTPAMCVSAVITDEGLFQSARKNVQVAPI